MTKKYENEVSDSVAEIWFNEPVEAPDIADGELVIANRHRLTALVAEWSAAKIRFVNSNGEIVAEWPGNLVKRMRWVPDKEDRDNVSGVGTTVWLAKQRKNHPLHGQRWTDELDAELTRWHGRGFSTKDLAAHFQRSRGGISSRLMKLGLIEPK